MVRRSSRLAKKKKVDYREDSLWYRAAKTGKEGWNKMVEVAADDPPPRAKPWQKKQMFQAKKKEAKKAVKLKTTRIEQDEKEVDFDRAEMESAQDRVDRIMKHEKPKSSSASLKVPLSRPRKHLLFMNPGDVPVGAAITSIAYNTPLPAWTHPFRNFLSVNGGKLIWTEFGKALPFALKNEKRSAVKRLYFDPREPSTIRPIAEKLYGVWANINRKTVRQILQSLETYQLNFGRRRPPDIKNRLFMKKPGMLAMDMFFPSAGLGWEKTNVLCCMDTWSRYCGVYVLDTKRYADVFKGMTDFLQKFASFGHPPRRILSDKGSDMRAAYPAIEPYRLPKDKNNPMVLHSATGTPVLIIEGLNAQVQRRMQVFRTSGLIDSAGQIAHEIADQINNEPRRDRGGLSPIQLLQLDAASRAAINKKYREKYVSTEIGGLKDLVVGDTVRLLKMTRKEQEQNKIKGFAPKWSKRLYTVLRKTKLRKNEFVFRYDIGLPDTYYRHELQKIHGGKVDTQVPRNYVRYKEVVIGGYEPDEDFELEGEWDH